MALKLIRRIPVAALVADTEWAHAAHADQDWVDRGFVLDSDQEHGARIPPGKEARIVGMVIVAEDDNGNEVPDAGDVAVSCALVQLLELEGSSASHYRQREPCSMRLGDLFGDPDISRNRTRMFPRLLAVPVLPAATESLAFYVGVL